MKGMTKNERNGTRLKAASFLKEYNLLKKNEKIVREQMYDTECMLHSLRISNPSASPNKGGGSRYEDFLVNQISKKEDLRLRLLIIETRKKFISRLLEILTPNEKAVIERFYLSENGKNAAEDMMYKLGFEKSQIYRLKDCALDKIGEYIVLTSESCNDAESYM